MAEAITTEDKDDVDAVWSRVSVVYGTGNEEIRIQAYFHPVHKPLKLYLNGEEAEIAPVANKEVRQWPN